MKMACLAAFVAVIIAVGFSIYPQVRLQTQRGDDFNGAFATYDLDETAYAAYLQALIDGRPRRNDPYTGRDDSGAEQQPESIFSIQFATAYPIAMGARIFGVTSAEVMPAVSVISALLTAIALFSLIFLICGDAWMSLAGTITVIAGGALISGIGVIGMLPEGGVAYPYLPLFRRHIPSLSFPFLFAFFAFLLAGLRTSTVKRYLFAAASAICFAFLLFSYFYLWTSALAVVAIAGVYLVVAKDNDRGREITTLAAAAGLWLLFLVLYSYLLSKRNPTADAAQLLVFTHGPDLYRNIEIIGTLVAAIVLIFAAKPVGWIDRRSGAFIFGFGLSAVLVFNQQVLTGRSLQPFHYEYYSVNYVVLLAAVLVVIVAAKRLLAAYPHLRMVFAITATVIATLWGAIEVYETSKFWDDLNIVRDEAMPVNRRLNEIAKAGPADPRTVVTLNLDSLQGDSQPTSAPFAVLWARHQHAFAGIVSGDESKLRYYKLVYFSGLDEVWLRKALTGCADIEACMTLFGWDRFNSTLSANARGLTDPEIDSEVKNYAEFVATFNSSDAYSPMLSYVVARKDETLSERLSRWYDVGPAEISGEFVLRQLTPRQADKK